MIKETNDFDKELNCAITSNQILKASILTRIFRAKRMRELIIASRDKPMAEQRQILDTAIEEWKSAEEQVDDILVIGVRV